MENCKIEVSPPHNPYFYPPSSLIRDFKNFKKSAAPSRFLSFRDGSWTDVAHQVFDVLKDGFLAGKTAQEADVDGVLYLFDFLRLSQIDMSTGAQRSIAWIDVDGRCFFPRVVIDKQEIAIRTVQTSSAVSSEHNSRKRKRDCREEYSDCWSSSSLERARWPGTKILKEGNRFFNVVAKLFLSGMRVRAPDAVITSICQLLPSNQSSNSQFQSFQVQLQRIEASRGDANHKFGWHGAASEGIARVMEQGFEHPNSRFLGAEAHGVGIHLSPAHSPYASCLFSEADDNDERHVILGRVIMGNSEKIPAGSKQSHPSSDQFDSGVDDPVNPKWYIVWDDNRNTHIYPEYVVSFKVSKQPQGPRRTMSQAKNPRVPHMSFAELISELRKSLPSTRMQEFVTLCNQLKAGKISKDSFHRCIRSIAGDNVLSTIVKRIRGH